MSGEKSHQVDVGADPRHEVAHVDLDFPGFGTDDKLWGVAGYGEHLPAETPRAVGSQATERNGELDDDEHSDDENGNRGRFSPASHHSTLNGDPGLTVYGSVSRRQIVRDDFLWTPLNLVSSMPMYG